MKNNKVSIDFDLEDLLGLSEPKKHTLEYDISFIMENGLEKYLEEQRKIQQAKDDFINTFNDRYVYNKIKDRLIREGFVYRCPFCLDLSNSYGRAIKKYKNEK